MVLTVLSDPSDPLVSSDPLVLSDPPGPLEALAQRVVMVKSAPPAKKAQPVLEIHYLSGLQVPMAV
jgi:hypothetical protein